MNKTFKFLIITIALCLISCTSENDDNDNQQNGNSNLVKREYVSNNVNLEYRYNNNNLDRIIDIDIQENIDSETNFTYNSSNVVTRNFESNTSNYSSMTSYSFNSSNKLLNAVSNISQPSNTINPTVVVTQEYTYDNNIITVDITSSIGDSKTVTLEENSSGLIDKMIENNFYVLITYDTNQNISKIEIFDNNDNLTNTSEYEYDNKPNPFYGQLSSIYLPIFLDAFDDANFNEFVWDGYEGYFFPFLKNNITSINENGNLDRNYNYVYNNENYPTNVIEIFNGNNSYEFDIEYE